MSKGSPMLGLPFALSVFPRSYSDTGEKWMIVISCSGSTGRS